MTVAVLLFSQIIHTICKHLHTKVMKCAIVDPKKTLLQSEIVCVAKNSNLKYGFKNLTRKVHMFNYCTKTKKQGQSKVQNDLSMKS